MKKKTVKKMRRLLATLLAFTLTFSLASTDVLAAGVAMAQEAAIEETVVDDGASSGEEAIADDASHVGEEVTGEEALEAEATGESESAAEGDPAGEIDEQAEVKTVAEGEVAEKSEATEESKQVEEVKVTEATEETKSSDEIKATEVAGETKVTEEAKATEAAEESKLAEEAKVAETTENAEEPEETKATEEISAPAETEETGETTVEEGAEEGTGKAGLRTRSLLRSSGLSGTIISEGFEDGIPEGWTLEGDTEGYNWGTSDAHHNGSKSAYMKYRSGDGQTAWLITPAYDFSSVTDVMKLSFWYYNRYDGASAKFEALSVCYRVDGGEWQELFKTVKSTSAWTEQILILPEGAKSANVEIGFCGTNHNGWGVNLDDVLLEIVESVQTHSVTYNANGGSGSMSDPNSPYLSGSEATVLSNGFTAPAGKKFVSWNTKADGNGTACSSGDQITVNEDVTLYAQWTNLKGILDEDFEEGTIPNGWAMESDREGFDWIVYQFSPSHSGEYGAVMYYTVAGSNGENIWLISPALNLSEVAGILKLSFWYENRPYGSDVDELRVCWRIDGGEWQELFATEGSVSEWTQQILALPEEAKTANVQIGFWGINHDGYYIYLDDVLLESTSDAQVYAVTYNANGGSGSMTDNASPYFSGSKVKVLENSFTAPAGKVFSAWNTKVDGSGTSYAPGDKLEITQNVMLYAQWGYAISISETITGGSVIANKTVALAGETVTLTVTPYECNSLEELTVKRGSESVALTKTDDGTYTFVMPEGNVNVEATFNLPSGVVFCETFEGGELPAGWTFTDSDGDTYGWNIKDVSQDKYGNPNSHSGSYVLTSESYINDVGALTPDNWAITPAITIPENAVLSFWIKAQDPDYPGDKMAVYVGLSPNVDAMTKVGGDYEAPEAFERHLVDLSAYEGQTVYVAFRHYDVSDLFWLNLDDVMVFGDGEGNTCRVTYDANGGSGEMTDLNMYVGVTKAIVLPNGFAAPAGKKFVSWNTKADGSGTGYAPGDEIALNGNIVLYARWTDLNGILDEDFEGGSCPKGWTIDSDVDGHQWKFIIAATEPGNYFASMAILNGYVEESVWLISPILNLSDVSGQLNLSFRYKNPPYSGKIDGLKAYYRIDGGEWQELFATEGSTSSWTQETLELPEAAKTANVQIGFRGINHGGYYVYLDDVLLEAVGNEVCAVTYYANGGSGETVDANGPYESGNMVTVMTNHFTAPMGKSFASWNTKADGSGTTYLPGSTFEITKPTKLYAQWKSVSTMPIQLTEGFEGGSIPEGWKRETTGYHWIVGTGDHTEVTGAHSGTKNALIAHVEKGMTSWLITPELDLRVGADYVLSFWYVNRAWGTDIDSLKVCYRVNGGEWVELFSTAGAHETWTKQEIKLPEGARQAGVEFGFLAADGYGYYVGLDDVQVRLYGNPVYKVTVEEAERGTVDVGESYVEVGQSFTVNYAPASGYKLAEINLDTSETCPQISEIYAGHYAFRMPAADVTVNVKFVSASETYDYSLWVAGMRVNTANASDVLGDGAASYNGITKTLTVKKDITCADDDAIYGEIDGLVIRTTAPLTITSTRDDGIQITGDTIIETKGLLTINGAMEKGGYGIYSLATGVVIRHAQIVVSGKWGIYGGNGPVEIRDSFITASGTYGAAKYVTLSGCQVVGPAGTTFGNDGVIRNADATVALKATISHVTEITKENPYVEGFEESGLPDRWLFIERDGDGELWFKPGSEDAIPHFGEGVLSSASYLSGVGGLTPDNWAFTEALRIPENAELSFWIRGQADRWSTEKLEVYVGYGPDDEDLTKVGEYVSNAEYTEYKVDLSEYAGQAVFIGFRHCDTENQYWLNLDDVTVRVGKLTDENLAVTKKTLTLFDTISIDFKVPAEAVANYHDPYLMVTQNGEETKLTTYREDGGFLIFSYRVPPQAMGDVATAVPHALNAAGDDVTGAEFSYSVAEYCYNMLNKETYQGAQYAKLRRLLVDILLYGDAAQIYANYKTDALAGANLTAAQRAMGTDVGVTMSYKSVKLKDFVSVSEADALASMEAATLYLEAAVNIQFKYLASNLDGLRVVVTGDAAGTEVLGEYAADGSLIDSKGRYYVNFGGLNAGQMRKTVYATVMKGDKKVSNTYRYSIESYVASMRTEEGTTPLDKLLDAMMRYGDSAAAYVGDN